MVWHGIGMRRGFAGVAPGAKRVSWTLFLGVPFWLIRKCEKVGRVILKRGASEGTALPKRGLGLVVFGCGDPGESLELGQCAPSLGKGRELLTGVELVSGAGGTPARN